MNEFSFERLEAYQRSRVLIKEVYRLIEYFPVNEKFSLVQQLQRSIVSVASNIAEGSGRLSYKEKVHFLGIAYGSLMEAFCQLTIAIDLGYIQYFQFEAIKPIFFEVSRLINGLKKSFADKY